MSNNIPGLVERLRAAYALVEMWPEREPDGFSNLLALRNLTPEAADALEALQAEVATQKARADDMHRRAQQAEAPKMAARDVANKMWNFVWKAGERYHKARARATAAEAERDALKAEVERKDSEQAEMLKLVRVAQNYIDCCQSGGNKSPYVEDNGLFRYVSPWRELVETCADLSPAKTN